MSIDTIYTHQLHEILNAGGIALEPEKISGGSNSCPNCMGLQTLMVFKPEGKLPTQAPPTHKKSKWLTIDGKTGWWAGEIVADWCPTCQNGRLKEWLTNACGLAGKDLDVSLEYFGVSGQFSEKAAARESAAGLLGMNKEVCGFVTYVGLFGVGKTHILKSLVNGFRRIEVHAVYKTVADLLSEIRDKFGDSPSAVDDAIHNYTRMRVLAVDEIDRWNRTSWAQETLFRLLDTRYNARDHLLTVMAMNSTVSGLPPEFDYLQSRMNGGEVIKVGGPDMRPAIGAKERKDTG